MTASEAKTKVPEAKELIKKDFMDRYNTWMQDRFDLNDHDYGWKYGWQKSEKLMSLKDNLTAVAMFQKYIYPVRRDEKFASEVGIAKEVVWELSHEKWLSSVQKKWELRYYINQKTAKEIWKEFHS